MLDDYGYDKSDHYPTNWAAESHRQILSRKSRTMQPERADVMPKLTLKSLARYNLFVNCLAQFCFIAFMLLLIFLFHFFNEQSVSR